jgi:DNA invertase Pin-like site-specific DNA recombinase
MRVIGYLRVSTNEQDLENCQAEILRFANEKRLVPVEFVEETISGTVPWKERELGRILEQLKPGDVVITSEISRLARSLGQIIQIIEYCKKKDIAVHAIKGGWSINGGIESKVVLYMLGMFAEIERDLISLRTKEALAARKAAGVRLGRKPGAGKSRLDKYRPEIEALLKNGSRKNFIAQRYGVTEPTLYNWLSKNSINVTPRLDRATA